MIDDNSAWAREFVLELLGDFWNADLGNFLRERVPSDPGDPDDDFKPTLARVNEEVVRMLAELRHHVPDAKHVPPPRGTTRYEITLSGCDDETEVTLDLDAAELAAIRRLADAAEVSSRYNCQPTIHIDAAPGEEQK